ncbi:MAG: glutathione binding-like protein, partial [Pseudomonadales bacterium]|nr:glutathione binding-like protein [Pseudomonadales bacterium]
QWQFYEQYSHEPFIAVARFIKRYLGMPEARRAEFEGKQAGGHRALAVMESALSASPFLIGNADTAADISLFGYTHVADEGGFELSGYPAVSAWIERIRALPGFVAMEPS